jgi:AmmeMemoRadiSam system protein A
MAPSPSADTVLDPEEVEMLIDIADASILAGLAGQRPSPPSPRQLPTPLQRPAGAFVTLKVRESLNGCVGTIQGAEALGVAVSRLSWSAAFEDPRLPALRQVDYDELTIEVSVLSPLSPIDAHLPERLLEQLRPTIDGLVIAAGRNQAVFLPSVWEQLPDPVDFLHRLQLKAGMRPGSWPSDLHAWRFDTTTFRRSSGPRLR